MIIRAFSERFASDLLVTNRKTSMKKEYIREISVIRTTNDLILRTDIYYTLRNYSKDDFSNLPGKASV